MNNIDSILASIDTDQPSLTQALEIQQRCAKVGFDWPSLKPVVDKVHEEIDEVMQEVLAVDVNQTLIEQEIGDLLFAVTNLARHLNCDPELALQQANQKFISRFTQIEAKVKRSGKSFAEHSIDELESYWQQVKTQE